jgi:hypothetical protein
MDRKTKSHEDADEAQRRKDEEQGRSPGTRRPRNPQDTGDRDPEEEGSAGKTQL